MNNTRNTNQGIALASTLIILSIFILIVYVVMSIFVPRIKLFQQYREWEVAFYLAETGAERCLYLEGKTLGGGYPQPGPIIISGGGGYETAPACGISGEPKRIIGTYNDSSVAIEIERYVGFPP